MWEKKKKGPASLQENKPIEDHGAHEEKRIRALPYL